jgi:hypothetical protein
MSLFDDLKKKAGIEKESGKELSQEECYKLIDSWGDDMEVRLNPDDFEGVKNEIWKAVQKERLIFNPSDETFKYVFKSPIRDRDGNIVISTIIIHETAMENKKGMSKKKDSIDTMCSFFGAYCKKDNMEEIQPGFLMRILDRDQAVISAVILGFFVQAVPSKKSEE